MEKLPYSEEFIRINSPLISGLSSNDIERLLMSRTTNLIDANYSMNYIDIIKITAFDHYMCKKIINNNNDIRMSKYFNELNKQLLKLPLLYYCLPIRKVNVEILRRHLPDIDKVIIACNQRKNTILTLGTRYFNGEQLSKNELDALIVFWNFYCNGENDLNEMQFLDKLVKDLLNRDSTLGLHSSSLIMKYFGYKKCQEEGLNDIQLFIGDAGETAKGVSVNKTITISKKHLVGTSFRNNKLEIESATLKNGKLEGLSILKTLFHEIRHAVQDKNKFENSANALSYMKSIREILGMNNDEEYHRNYRYYDIEADANNYGWMEIRAILKDYMNFPEKKRLDAYADIYATEHLIRKSFPAKTDENNKLCPTWTYMINSLDNYFRQNPSDLNGKYSHFKKFYNSDGSAKTYGELLLLDSADVRQYSDLYLNMINARVNNKLDIGINSLSLEGKKNIIRNYNTIIYAIYDKLSNLKMIKLDGSYLIDGNTFSNTDRAVLKYNAVYYFKMAKIHARYVSRIIELSPELLGYNGGPFSINHYLRLINRNKLVQSFVEGEQIAYIPENANDLISLNSVGKGK